MLFNVTADSRGYVDLKKLTFRVTSSQNATVAEGTEWNSCTNLGQENKWQVYDRSEPSNLLGAWAFYAEDGRICDGENANARLGYAQVDFEAGTSGVEEIGAGQTKTYAVRLDTTGASAAMDDSIRLDIPSESQLPYGGDLLVSLLWGDDNTGQNATGWYVRNLPVLGGTIGY